MISKHNSNECGAVDKDEVSTLYKQKKNHIFF